MKKLVSCLLAVACIATMSVGVMAEDTVKDYTPTNGKYTVEVTERLTNGARYGFLVLNTNALTNTISEDSIMYINQANAEKNENEQVVVKFENFIPKTELAKDSSDKYYVFLGGEGYAATQIATLSAAQSVHAESVAITPATLTLRLAEGQTVTGQLTATMTPAESVDTIEWSVTAGSEYASVDANGLVTAIAKGEATITATTSNGKTASCVVTVTDGLPGDLDGNGVAGDMNGDGYITKADAILLGKHAVNQNRYPVADEHDTNGDGFVTKADAILLGKHAVNQNRYPIYPTQSAQ